MPSIPSIALGPETPLALPAAARIAEGMAIPSPTAAAMAGVARAHERLAAVIAGNRHVYGITTGFGPLANRRVAAAEGETLQQNLVHHLASGVGPPLGWAEARAVMLARLMSLLQGWSGASPEAVALLVAVLSSDLAPKLPSRGTVGASGDLTPLAHMVLCLQGRGDFLDRTGAEISGPEALARLGRDPLSLVRRDGLALVNGTSAMTGLAVLSSREAQRALSWAVALSAGMMEVMRGHAEAWAPEFARARPHPGQAWAADALRARLDGATEVQRDPIARGCPDAPVTGIAAEAGQDAYTLRCAPQVIGAVADSLAWHDRVTGTELNAATDNPIFPQEGDVPALHGGNFMGQHVGLVSDALCNALVVLAGLAERQVARLTDERLNGGLPAFLHRGTPGLNSGFMGAQVTATAILAEMRARLGPVSGLSISTNGANQDVVSLGTIAARGVRQALPDLFRLQAILAMAVAQARDIRGLPETAWSRSLVAVCTFVRSVHPPLETDRPLGGEIEALALRLGREDPPEAGRV